MDLSFLRDELSREIKQMGFGGNVVAPMPRVEKTDLILRTQCYEAFFRILGERESLREVWDQLQSGVAEHKRVSSDLPRDSYIVFIISHENPSASATLVQKINDDPFLCRKFVLLLENGDLQTVLRNLPFFPEAEPNGSSALTLSDVVGAYRRRGYPAETMEAFGRRAPHSIAEELLSMDPPSGIPTVETQDFGETRTGAPWTDSNNGYFLQKISIKDFRGIRETTLDLSSNLTVLYGRNGTGKTSVVDAIEWALLGDLQRLSQDCPDDQSRRSPLVNLFSKSGTAWVELLASNGSQSLTIGREVDINGVVSTKVNGRDIGDEHAYLDELIGPGAAGMDLRVVKRLLRTTGFLAQHTLREFLSDSQQERYRSLSHLLGTYDFAKYLEKVSAVKDELRSLEETIATHCSSLKEGQANLAGQIEARRRLLSELPTGRRLVRELQEAISNLRKTLSSLGSNLVQAVPPTAENYDDVLSFTNILKDYSESLEENLLRKQEMLQEGQKAFERLPSTEARLEEAKSASARLESELQALRQTLDELRTSRVRLYTSEVQLEGEIQQHATEQQQLELVSEALATIGRIEGVLAREREKEKSLGSEWSALQLEEKRLAERSEALAQSEQRVVLDVETNQKRLKGTVELREMVKKWLSLENERPDLEKKFTDSQADLRNLSTRHSDLERDIRAVSADLTAGESQLATMGQSLEKFRQLLFELRDFVRGAECPLCGHDWREAESLKGQIVLRSEGIPGDLERVRSHYDSQRARKEQLVAQLQTVEAQLESLENETNKMQLRLGEIRRLSSEIQASALDLNIKSGVAIDTPGLFEQLESEYSKHASVLMEQKLAITSEMNLVTVEMARLRARLGNTRSEVTTCQETIAKGKAEIERHNRNVVVGPFAEVAKNATKIRERISLLGRLLQEATRKRDEIRTHLAQLTASMSGAEGNLQSLQEKRQMQAQEDKALNLAITALRQTLSEAKLVNRDSSAPLTAQIVRIVEEIQQCRDLKQEVASAEKLASWLATEKDIRKLETQVEDLEKELQKKEADRGRTGLWARHLEKLNDSIVSIRGQIENRQLQRYEPTINRIYRRLYSHPLFNSIRTKVDSSKGAFAIQVDLDAKWVDSVRFPTSSLAPTRYFSEAQLNVLALSIFLSNALSQRWSQFVPLFLDDPVQNMDEFNTNAFVDTLRTYAAGRRQFFLTTCDLDLYQLALAKLGCLNEGGKTGFVAYRFEEFTSEGPTIRIDTGSREAAA